LTGESACLTASYAAGVAPFIRGQQRCRLVPTVQHRQHDQVTPLPPLAVGVDRMVGSLPQVVGHRPRVVAAGERGSVVRDERDDLAYGGRPLVGLLAPKLKLAGVATGGRVVQQHRNRRQSHQRHQPESRLEADAELDRHLGRPLRADRQQRALQLRRRDDSVADIERECVKRQPAGQLPTPPSHRRQRHLDRIGDRLHRSTGSR
jgi:hypothetical protein